MKEMSTYSKHLGFIFMTLWMNVVAVGQDGPGGADRRPGGGQGELPPNLTGKVVDAGSGEKIEFATVAAYTLPDSTLATGGVTDASGQFALRAKPGKYYLKIQFVSYESTIVKDIAITRGTPLDLGVIRLNSDAQELDEVTVQAERTQMELSLDKKIYNVGKDLSNMGGTASDILDNLPSVTVDVEGNVELRGSSNVQVLIDGKPSGLIGLSSTDALRQLQGNMIERVEIITNPSARYDASGMAGIINIVLKKEKKKGVNGSFQLNTGLPNNHGISGNVNFRRSFVNLFTNYGINFRQSPGGGSSVQQFDLADTSYMTNLSNDRIRGGLSNNFRFGADWFLSDKATVTTSFLYRVGDEVNNATISYTDIAQSGEPIAFTRREDEENEIDENLEYAINFTQNFEREGHKLTADIQYQDNHEVEQSEIVQSEGFGDALEPTQFQKVRNEEGEQRWMLQSDYIHPFGEKGKFELGYRSTLRDILNNYEVQDLNEEGIYVPVDTFTSDFGYDENVHAAYGIVSNEIARLSWQMGLRMEMTRVKTEFQETGESFEWNYTNLFPSAFVTYKLPSDNQLQLSYSRRINRPRFRELNPFSSFTDNRNFWIGNPNLQPEFTDSYEFGLLQNIESASIYYGIYYRYTTQLIQRVTFQPNAQGQRVRRPENIGYSGALGLELNASQEFTDWYRVSGNFNFYRREVQGSVGDTLDLAAVATTFTTRLSNNFKLGNFMDAQLNLNYRAPQDRPQGRRLSVTVVDAGFSKDLFSDKATLSLSVRDLFNSRKYRSITELPTFYEESEFQWRRGPNFILTFTYRLNQRKERGRNRGNRDGGDFEEEGF